MKLISIVTPCYNEEENVHSCHQAVADLFKNQLKGYDYEHIFCDNASTDRTAALLEEVAATDPKVKVILNSNNFGFLRSMFNGTISAKGDAVVPFLPADLQDPPELIPEFVKYWEQGYRVVYGQRDKREEAWLMLLGRKMYYKFITKFAKTAIPLDAGEFQLIDRKVVEALKLFDDYDPYLRGMIASVGFKRIGVKYLMKRRERGTAKGRLGLLLNLGVNGIISTTTIPIRIGLFVGFTMASLSILWAFINLGLYIFTDRLKMMEGMASVLIGLFLLSGIQIFFISLVGEYVASIHSQVRRGPLVVEEKRINFDNEK